MGTLPFIHRKEFLIKDKFRLFNSQDVKQQRSVSRRPGEGGGGRRKDQTLHLFVSSPGTNF